MKRCIALLLLAGVAAPVLAAPSSWQRDVTAPDRKRLARLWDAWTHAINQAQAAGQLAALAALGPVAVPDAATMRSGATTTPPALGPLPGPGSYQCRSIALGQRDGERPAPPAAAVDAGPMLPCRITMRGDTLWFEQLGGAQRLSGRLYPDGDRQIFLGTKALTGEMGHLPYGADPQRNAVGALRAMAPAQWRLELPWPNWQSNLGIIEMIPG